MDNAFRKLNVDQYDEDLVLPSDLCAPDPRGPAGSLSDAKGKESAVRALLQRGEVGGALECALKEPAYGDGEEWEEAKVRLIRLLRLLSEGE